MFHVFLVGTLFVALFLLSLSLYTSTWMMIAPPSPHIFYPKPPDLVASAGGKRRSIRGLL